MKWILVFFLLVSHPFLSYGDVSSKRIVYEMPDGTIRFVVPVNRNITIQEIINQTEETDKDLSESNRIGVFEKTDLPQNGDEQYRWRIKSGLVVVDLDVEIKTLFPKPQEQLDALFEGGQAIVDMKERIRNARGN